MKLIVWLDVACPFCYIGKTNLDRALKQLQNETELEVVYKSFRLNPTAPVNPEFTMAEELADKYQKSESEVDEMIGQVEMSGKEARIDFDMASVVPSNTMDAHRLVKFASETGKAGEVLSKLYAAYFEDGRNTADRDVLMEIAEDAGLDAVTIKDKMDSDLYKDLIYADQNEAKDIGVQGVPFLVINGDYAVPGARQPEDYLKALEEAQK